MRKFLNKNDSNHGKFSQNEPGEELFDLSVEESYEQFHEISMDELFAELGDLTMEDAIQEISGSYIEEAEPADTAEEAEEISGSYLDEADLADAAEEKTEETAEDFAEEPQRGYKGRSHEKKPSDLLSNIRGKVDIKLPENILQKIDLQKLKAIRQKFNTVPVPSWLFLLFMAVFCECMLHFWVMDGFSFSRFATVLLFALGFGCLLGTITSFFGWKGADKWVAATFGFAMIVLYLVEYFVSDTYQVFMTMETLLSGAGGVMTDFAEEVTIVVLRGMGKILFFLLPWVLYILFAKSVPTVWRTRYFLTVGIAAAYLLGYGVVQGVGTDAARWKTSYNFDSAVKAFGLNTSLALDVVNSGDVQEEEEFVVIDVPAPTVPLETQPAEQTQEEETFAAEPQVMDLDFAALYQYEKDRGFTRAATLHKYVSTVQPSMTNEYTGMFAGKNLIVVVAEAFAKEVIDPELTPTLYRLANEGVLFHDYYQPMWGGSTSSGEYSVLTGLVASRGTASVYEATEQDLFLTMGKQLQRQGYNTFAYHNHLVDFYGRNETHPHFGYDSFMAMGNGMEKGVQERWPQSDLEMIDFTVEQFIDKQPFHAYYMTVSGHCRYNRGGNKMSNKNYDKVKDLDTSEGVKCYIAANLELENAMASLVKQLEEAGIADDTVIVLSTDHYPYGLEWDDPKDIERLYGYKYKDVMQRDHSALILWSGCIEDMDLEITAPTYSLDILPTLSNLFGLEYDSRLLVGRDVFSDTEAIVLWYDYTWITEKGRFNSQTGKFTPNEGVEVEDGYVERIAAIVANKIKFSREAANIDYFNYLSKELFPDKWKK